MQRNVRNGQKVFRFGKKQNSAQLFARLPKVRNYDLAECFFSNESYSEVYPSLRLSSHNDH